MKLIADSGSTKCSWRLLNEGTIQSFETTGVNPFFVGEEEMLKLFRELAVPHQEVQELYFYGAGCAQGAASVLLLNSLSQVFPNAEVYVDSDILAAARATLGVKEGLVGILGTGANTAFYTGEHVQQKVPSLGYVLGDEGSGAYMGRLLLSAYLRGELSDELAKKLKLSKEEILQKVYKEGKPNRYLASFAPFMFRNRDNVSIAQLLKKCFQDWVIHYVLPYQQREIHLVGSVAYYFQREIADVLSSHGLKMGVVLENPIASLSLYHSEE